MKTKLAILALLAGLGLAAPGSAEPAKCDLAAKDAASAGAGCARAWIDRNLKLNDLVAVGTHNSYKGALPPAVMALVRAKRPEEADGLDYGHRPLSEQLDAGARQLEIDVYYDPRGGRYADPVGLRAAGEALDPARRAAFAGPGFKVMHIQDVDVFSTCVRLVDCLGAIRRWSLAHPDHAPILLMFNAKTDASPAPGGTDALAFDAAAFDALDAEVRSVFPPSALITPDDVQGAYPSLREAVLAGNWPRLGAARGKVLFALDEPPEKTAAYRGARKSLEGRVFFVDADPSSPIAAYMTINDPVGDASRIREAVQQGFIVRTRADAGTVEARTNDARRRAAALASGAQYISTDYLWPDPRFPGAYQVRLTQGAAALCNPVRAADRCGGAAIESVSPPSVDYLTPEATPDGVRVLPPPPRPGGAQAAADAEVFKTTRKAQGGARWGLATSDVDTGAFEHFACALGAKLTPDLAPATARLLDRANTGGLVDQAKSFYRTPRPYLSTTSNICQAKTAHLDANPDYPSGHAAGGWMEALILAELAPDRATEILARGRAFGESRVICGAHSLSAVQAGWMAGAAVTAALHAQPAFRRDLEAARSELPKARAAAPSPDPAACRAETAALAERGY
jgi:membrane-associated phospholipid phosphatase